MRMGESLGAEHPLRLATALRVVLPRRDRAVPAGRADLHVHSIWSDGAQAPAAIVRAAAGRVDVLAITDHDEIRGALEAREFARAHSELGIDVVIVNNSGIFSRIYDAWAALRNVEWMLPVTGGSDAHDVWYVGGALTRFHGRDASALRRDLLAGRTRAHARWSWPFDKMPRHLRMPWRSAVRFVRLNRRPIG